MKKNALLKRFEKGLSETEMNKHFSIMILLLRVAEHYNCELIEMLEPFGLSCGKYEDQFTQIKDDIDNLVKMIYPAQLSNERKLFLMSDFEYIVKIIDEFMKKD